MPGCLFLRRGQGAPLFPWLWVVPPPWHPSPRPGTRPFAGAFSLRSAGARRLGCPGPALSPWLGFWGVPALEKGRQFSGDAQRRWGESGEPGIPHPMSAPSSCGGELRERWTGPLHPMAPPSSPLRFRWLGCGRLHPEIGILRHGRRAGFGPGLRRKEGGGCRLLCCFPPWPCPPSNPSTCPRWYCHLLPPPLLCQRGWAPLSPGQKQHVCPLHPCNPFGSLAGAAVHVGGPFLCPPSLPSPFPAASPEISRDKLGRAGTGLLAAFRGEDGGCCCPAPGPAAPWGAALSPRPGAPPGPPRHL